MNTSSDNHVDEGDEISARILGTGPTAFPVLTIGDVNIYPPHEGTTAWLRNLMDQLEDLAEQIDLAHGRAIEQHMDDAIAAAGIGA